MDTVSGNGTINRAAYLARIGYTGSQSPTAGVLRELQRAHLLTVPFENLDIHLKRPIQLKETALFDKIVTRRRGGFCYELNGLFAHLLAELGFEVTLLNARGVNENGSLGINFDHLALQVRAPDDPEGSWLVDVGWGNGPFEPLRLEERGVQLLSDGRSFQLQANGDTITLAEHTGEAFGWLKHYAFTLQPQVLAAFASGCQYHQTSPASIFTQKRICSRFLPDGHITLTEQQLILTRAGGREEHTLEGPKAYTDALRADFGIVL